jgi:hypothetical protein
MKEMRNDARELAEKQDEIRKQVEAAADQPKSLSDSGETHPVLLTRAVKSLLTRVTLGGAPVYVWPGGGITVMADVTRMPKHAFGYVPTPALVAPIEFTLPRTIYEKLGGHTQHIVTLNDVINRYKHSARTAAWLTENPWPLSRSAGDADTRTG